MINNKYKLFIVIELLGIIGTAVFGEQATDRFDFVIGPRVGFTYTMVDKDLFTSQLNQVPMFNRASYVPFVSEFGFSLEQRVLLGTTKSHFVFEEIALVGGLDQSLAIPTFSLMLGYRSDFGLELGLGPIWSLSGLAVVYSLGWTFEFSDVYVPINIAFIPDFNKGQHTISFFTGFNFNID